MGRLVKFTSLFGENWVTGRYILPELERIGNQQQGTVLDLACGESPFRRWFPNAKAYLRVDRSSADPEVMLGDMRSIPLEDSSVDMVLLFQAVTDVPNPIDVLKESKRVLRQGGQILIFESMAYPEHDAPYDFFRIMPDGLRSLASEAGLEVKECIRLGGLFTRFASLWNSCVMGGLKQYLIFRPVASLGIAVGNLLCYGLDRLAPHPNLASDYLALIELTDNNSKK